MSTKATKGPAGLKVAEQLAARPIDGPGEQLQAAELRANETRASTSVIERISSARRGYLAWLALKTASITGKEPTIDSDADASWRAR